MINWVLYDWFFHPFVHSLLPSSNNKTYFKTHAHCTWTIFSNDFVNSAKILRNEQMKTCFYQKCSMDWNYCRFWKTDWSGQSISKPISMTKGSPYILLQFLWSYSLKWFLQKCLKMNSDSSIYNTVSSNTERLLC